MYRWYEHCEIYKDRCAAAARLKLPSATEDEYEPAPEFWSRVERAGLLLKALALYDRLAAARAAWRQARRETKKQFAQRVEREGRQAEAECLRAQLLASGRSRREAQAALVERLQPLDGSATRAWETPDPWEAGRLFHKKADQDALLARVNTDEEEDEEEEVRWRVECARRRREERLALAAARRRAQALKAAAPE